MSAASPTRSTIDALRARIPELEPFDEHNRRLLANVHPPDRANPAPADRYNLVVIGAGSAGLVTAAGAAGLGARVAIVERRLLGGDCLNVGCVPSKALIRCARAAGEARRAAEFGVRTDGVQVDFGAVMERMRRLRAGISPHDSVERFSGMGIDVFLGDATFVDRSTVRVGDTVLRFARAVIASGARAAAPSIAGIEHADVLTNETLFSLTELPRRLVVIGAGPIGCEMAQAFARFGSEVTLVEAGPRILSREDGDAAAIIDAALRGDGVRVLTDAGVERLERSGSTRSVHLRLKDHGAIAVEADQVLVGVGRRPNLEGLGLDAAGVEHDERRGVVVDDFLRTSNRNIYAAGDICSALKFTHLAEAHARMAIQNALFFGRARVSRLVVPWCTYTDPELAHVGASPAEAKARGIDVRSFRVEMSSNDRARLDGDDEGFAVVHTRAGSDRILGATVVARHAGDLIGPIVQAMTLGIGLKGIGKVIHPYPTQGDVVRRVADAYARSRLTPTVAGIFRRVMAWRR